MVCLSRCVIGAKELTQPVKCLPDKREDLSLDSPAPTGKAVCITSVIPDLESHRGPEITAKLASFKFS